MTTIITVKEAEEIVEKIENMILNKTIKGINDNDSRELNNKFGLISDKVFDFLDYLYE